MAKKTKKEDLPVVSDVMDEAPKKFQRLMMHVKAKNEAPQPKTVEHPWKIQPGESYTQFEARLQQTTKKDARKTASKKEIALDLKLEALKTPLDKPLRKQLKRKERRLKLKEKRKDSSDEEMLIDHVPFGEQALAPPNLKPPKATLKMPKSLTHAGRTSLLPQ